MGNIQDDRPYVSNRDDTLSIDWNPLRKRLMVVCPPLLYIHTRLPPQIQNLNVQTKSDFDSAAPVRIGISIRPHSGLAHLRGPLLIKWDCAPVIAPVIWARQCTQLIEQRQQNVHTCRLCYLVRPLSRVRGSLCSLIWLMMPRAMRLIALFV